MVSVTFLLRYIYYTPYNISIIMASPILTVSGLHVALQGQQILRDVSFTLARGESLALIGPNGSGKTVLLRALIGVLPSSGVILWAKDVRLGYVPQRIDLERSLPLTFHDFLMTKVRLLRLPQSAIPDALHVVRLPMAVLPKKLGQLSGGQLQRALIAFALLGEPNVLLFDEPTTGVDLPREEQIYDTIHRLQDERQLTLMLVSHDLSLVYRYATSVMCLNRSIVCYGMPQQVLTSENLSALYGERVLYHHDHDH